MLIFVDTEFTDFIQCELISIGLVSEDEQYSLYLEVSDFERALCNAFVQSAVLPQLGQSSTATMPKSDVQAALLTWFARLPSEVSLAVDSQYDLDLLQDIVGGQWPTGVSSWVDLRPMATTAAFKQAMANYHNNPARPWHHALHDAYGLRAGWLAWQASSDPAVDSAAVV
ncbi:protein of unknown function [Andreprevotia lacus DSM 23236]|jgi:hypothetical protein|uniref:Uncharacterized protein n=1 Tax=Andreprevotia lacus DSM 23236 TaxID=1121001 RepID=A0A1W1XZI7_9NEIS|nr:3'-5' exoribonuclease [Andreprevotia lacus]SMC29380.1 protein of unknown function [Andreprevotia lacus DSM 23236]